MNNEKRFECDVVVMPGAELDTDICITGNVYMEKGSNANGYDIDVGESFFANHADFFNVYCGQASSVNSLMEEIYRLNPEQRKLLEAFLHSLF